MLRFQPLQQRLPCCRDFIAHRPAARRQQTWCQARPTAAHSSSQQQLGSDVQSNILCLHPDAVARRQAVEHRRAVRSAETEEMRACGPEWWRCQAPRNMQTVSTPAEYEQALQQCKQQNQLVVVHFFAPWCAGCRMLYPKLRQIASANLDVAFIKVNTELDEMREYSQDLGVTGLPYFHLHCGQRVEAFSANLSKVSRLRQEIAALKQDTGIAAAAEAAAAAGVAAAKAAADTALPKAQRRTPRMLQSC